MIPVTYLFAFSEPNLDLLTSFAEYVGEQLDACGSIRIGVASDQGLPALAGVTYFPYGTGPMAIYNQLAAAEPPGQVLFISQGPSLPVLGDAGRDRVRHLPPGSCLTLDGRVPILSQQLELDEVLGLDWSDVEFTRNVHEESPLGFAVRREDFLCVRGFDERPIFNTSYVMDLLARFRRFAMPRLGLGMSDGFIVDLEPVFPGLMAESLPLNVSLRENQKGHIQSDPSIFRNLINWSVPRARRPVLVSVAVATRDRADYLMDSIRSVQAQTFEDWELLIVDDGSRDHTREVVGSVSDPRVKYLSQEASGISAARNRAAEHSVGYFTAVHDDDDLMLPWRLETSLNALSAEAQATYGSWVNFNNESGSLALHITKRDFGQELVAFSGQTPGHATWLLPTAVVRSLQYDETLSSSVDHNLAVRSVMTGIRWRHSEKVLFLRRLHPAQVSQTDSRRQRAAAILTRFANTFSADFNGGKALAERGKALTFPAPVDKQRLFETFGAYLPDHLVRRGMTVQGLVGKKILALELHDRFQYIVAETDLLQDRATLELGGVEEITWDDLVAVRRSGFPGFSYTFEERTGKYSSAPDRTSVASSAAEVMHRRIMVLLQAARKLSPAAVLVVVDGEHFPKEIMNDIEGVVSGHHFSINQEPDIRISRLVIGFEDVRPARSFAESLESQKQSWSIVVPVNRDISNESERHLGAVVAS